MELTLRVQKPDRPELVAYDRILKRYGAGCYPQQPQDRQDHWRVPVGAYFQSRIVDDKTNRERVLTLNFKNVGEILVNKSTMRVSAATPLRSLGKNIFRKRAEIRKIVEQDLIRVLGKREMNIRFLQMKYALSGLQPIYRTLHRLLGGEYPSYDELVSSGEHYLEQVELLVDIGYAVFEKDPSAKLVATNKTKELYAQVGNMERTIEIVLGMVLSEFYYDLRKRMRVAQFVPYVRASTSYYGHAVQFGDLIRVSEKRLRENVRDYYRGMPLPPRLEYAYPTIVRELVDAQVLKYDREYITGRADIYEQLIGLKNRLPISEEPVSFG